MRAEVTNPSGALVTGAGPFRTTVFAGVILPVLRVDGGRVHVRLGDGSEGWVSRADVQLLAT